MIADPDTDDATKADMAAWTGCVAGALTEAEFRGALETAGFDEIEIQPTHRVPEYASAAIVRARKPAACCSTDAQIPVLNLGARAGDGSRRVEGRAEVWLISDLTREVSSL